MSVDDKTIVYFEGKPILGLNTRLLDSQGAWDNLELIKKLHVERLGIHKKMSESDCPAVLTALDKEYTDVEFRLQDAWKFDRNANFHRFWERPKCGCPRMDNEDWYPYRSVVSGGCAVHGHIVTKNIKESKESADK